jgi:hypothetical protein
MKSVLYVGATLMIGASIYGFVDYRKTSHKKEFNNMYKEKEVTEPAKAIDEKTVVSVDKKEATVKEEKTVATPAKKETKKVAKKKKRKLDTKLFSRGALDERYIKEEKILIESEKEKTDAVKTEKKEQ